MPPNNPPVVNTSNAVIPETDLRKLVHDRPTYTNIDELIKKTRETAVSEFIASLDGYKEAFLEVE